MTQMQRIFTDTKVQWQQAWDSDPDSAAPGSRIPEFQVPKLHIPGEVRIHNTIRISVAPSPAEACVSIKGRGEGRSLRLF